MIIHKFYRFQRRMKNLFIDIIYEVFITAEKQCVLKVASYLCV
jgi:hypothetical protein